MNQRRSNLPRPKSAAALRSIPATAPAPAPAPAHNGLPKHPTKPSMPSEKHDVSLRPATDRTDSNKTATLAARGSTLSRRSCRSFASISSRSASSGRALAAPEASRAISSSSNQLRSLKYAELLPSAIPANQSDINPIDTAYRSLARPGSDPFSPDSTPAPGLNKLLLNRSMLVIPKAGSPSPAAAPATARRTKTMAEKGPPISTSASYMGKLSGRSVVLSKTQRLAETVKDDHPDPVSPSKIVTKIRSRLRFAPVMRSTALSSPNYSLGCEQNPAVQLPRRSDSGPLDKSVRIVVPIFEDEADQQLTENSNSITEDDAMLGIERSSACSPLSLYTEFTVGSYSLDSCSIQLFADRFRNKHHRRDTRPPVSRLQSPSRDEGEYEPD